MLDISNKIIQLASLKEFKKHLPKRYLNCKFLDMIKKMLVDREINKDILICTRVRQTKQGEKGVHVMIDKGAKEIYSTEKYVKKEVIDSLMRGSNWVSDYRVKIRDFPSK